MVTYPHPEEGAERLCWRILLSFMAAWLHHFPEVQCLLTTSTIRKDSFRKDSYFYLRQAWT